MKRTFQVTQTDIDTADKILTNHGISRCENCPVTQALNRTTGQKWYTSPFHTTLFDANGSVYQNPDIPILYFSEQVSSRIRAYDKEGVMSPFEFELELPNEL